MKKLKILLIAVLMYLYIIPVFAQSDFQTLNSWVGKYPVEINVNPRRSLYQAKLLRPKLVKLLGAKYYKRLADGYYVMSKIELIEGYLIAQMCEQHNCPSSNSFMAVNLKDGDIHVAFFNQGVVEWFHTKGKAIDLPHDVFYKLWWMNMPEKLKVKEVTRGAT